MREASVSGASAGPAVSGVPGGPGGPGGPGDEALDALAARVEEAAGAIPNGRYLLGIAGSPGSGKTTLARALVQRLCERADAADGGPVSGGVSGGAVSGGAVSGGAVHLPMDGFHLSNATLDRLGLRDRKGAIETFDGWGFLALLDRVRAETEHTVYAPSFHRTVDEGVAGDIPIGPEARIVVVEGNYLLADREPWGGVLERLDAAWFCSTPAEDREARLVDRHTRHGRSVAAAEAWAREVDGANAELVEATAARAGLIVSGVTGRVLGEAGRVLGEAGRAS